MQEPTRRAASAGRPRGARVNGRRSSRSARGVRQRPRWGPSLSHALPPLLSPPLSRSRYSSFLRSLCYYNFQRVTGSTDSCEYSHGDFHRDRPGSVRDVRI
jgi:hypothetical protein